MKDEDSVEWSDDGLPDVTSDQEPDNWDGQDIPDEVYKEAAIEDAKRLLSNDQPF